MFSRARLSNRVRHWVQVEEAARFCLAALRALISNFNAAMWQNYLTSILGLAVIVVAFLGLDSATLMWTLGILGAGIAILGISSAGVFGAEPTIRNA